MITNQETDLEEARHNDRSHLAEIAINFKAALTSEQFLRLLARFMSGLVRSGWPRPHLQMRWGTESLTLVAIIDETGPRKRLQELFRFVEETSHDLMKSVILRDTWTLPEIPTRVYLRIAHVRLEMTGTGPQPEYVRFYGERATMLLAFEQTGMPSLEMTDTELIEGLARELRAPQEQFTVHRWTAVGERE
jgi:hypothetical protein